jgi:hypothetical protein
MPPPPLTCIKASLSTFGKVVSFEDVNLLVLYYLSASEIWFDIKVAFGTLVGEAF